jgi:hypothetical protein
MLAKETDVRFCLDSGPQSRELWLRSLLTRGRSSALFTNVVVDGGASRYIDVGDKVVRRGLTSFSSWQKPPPADPCLPNSVFN